MMTLNENLTFALPRKTGATGGAAEGSNDFLLSASSVMEVYLQPLIVLLGVVGNVLSFLILSLPNYKKQSTCIYMKGMAISDSMYLMFYVLQRTVISIKNKEIRTLDNFRWLCNQYLFWSYYAGITSALILQTMSMERLFALLFPLKAKTWCSARKARIVVVSLFVILCVILLPLNLSRVQQDRISGWLCPFHFDVKMAEIYDNFISIFDVYMPFVVISISNVGIVIVLKISERRRQELTTETKTATSNQVFRMLFVVSLAFIVLKLPGKVRNSLWRYYTGEVTPLIVALRRFTVTLTDILGYCNYAFNTYLYIFSVKKFRQEAKVVCRCGGDK
jgi:hypothetical protein